MAKPGPASQKKVTPRTSPALVKHVAALVLVEAIRAQALARDDPNLLRLVVDRGEEAMAASPPSSSWILTTGAMDDAPNAASLAALGEHSQL